MMTDYGHALALGRAGARDEALHVLDGLIESALARHAAACQHFDEHLALPAPGDFPALTRERLRFYSERDRRRCRQQAAHAEVGALRLARAQLSEHFAPGARTPETDFEEDR